jgi:hypothetical protein
MTRRPVELIAVLLAALVGIFAPVAVEAAAIGLRNDGFAEASAKTFIYDGSAVARVDVHSRAAAGAAPTLLSGAREESASLSTGARGASTTPHATLVATNTADDVVGLADDYIDITAKGSRVRNVQTSVNRSSFEQNLIDSGYQPTVVGQGKNVVSYELNRTRYVVRDAATSTGGPTADFYPAGSSSFTLKIRLAG